MNDLKMKPVLAFRVDAAVHIGTGHVMRCLTLADAYRKQGGRCHFISRNFQGHLFDLIRSHGHIVHELPYLGDIDFDLKRTKRESSYSLSLGCDWWVDAHQTRDILSKLRPGWLVVDHYGIDRQWEEVVELNNQRLMVIDDLANRRHICDVLLDQNVAKNINFRYQNRVPQECITLLGPKYAIVRPSFTELRAFSLARRTNPVLDRLLVFMGGSDPTNEIQKVIVGQ